MIKLNKNTRLLWSIIGILFFVTGCVDTQTRTATVLPPVPVSIPQPIKYPTTGSEVTIVWSDYDTFAQENNKPRLNFISTSKGVKNKVDPVGIADVFSDRDEDVYICTQWTNMIDIEKYEVKVYEPGGQLFKKHKIIQRHNTNQWRISTRIRIKDFPAIDLPGNWTAEIYMNNQLAYSKQFQINSAFHVKKTHVLYRRIGILPFYDSNMSRRIHSKPIAGYLAQKLIGQTDATVLLPAVLAQHVSSPPLLDDYPTWLINNLRSSHSTLSKLMEKYDLDSIVTGTVLDTMAYSKPKKISTYLIDREEKTVEEVSVTSFISDKTINTTGRAVRASFYNAMFKDFIENF